MVKITLKIDGMACGMCEAHMNDAIRSNFPVKKVTSSHTKGETVILAELPPDEDKLRDTISAIGYKLENIRTEAYVKPRGLLGLFRKNA